LMKKSMDFVSKKRGRGFGIGRSYVVRKGLMLARM